MDIRFSELTNSISSFRTGDVIPVDGPEGTVKMSASTLKSIMKDNTLATTDNNAYMVSNGDVVRIKDLTTAIHDFRSGDVIPVDGPDGTAKMSKDSLLELTSENALGSIKSLASTKYKGFMALDDADGTGKFNIESLLKSIAPIFDPTKTEGDAYAAGDKVMYQGQMYRFKVPHYGAWASADATLVPLSDVIFDIMKEGESFTGCNPLYLASRDYAGKQHNVNIFENIVLIPKDKRQWLNKNYCAILDAYINSGTVVAGNGIFKCCLVKLLSGKKYRFSASNSLNRFNVAVYQDFPAVGSTTSIVSSDVTPGQYSRKYHELDVPEGYNFAVIYFYAKSLDGDDWQSLLDTIMVSDASEEESDFVSFTLDKLSFDVAHPKFEFTKEYGMLTDMLNDSVVNPDLVEDVTTSFDLDHDHLKYLNALNFGEYNSTVNSVSKYVDIDPTNLYFCYIANDVPNNACIVYYDKDGTPISAISVGTGYLRSKAFAIIPPEGALRFRISSNPANTKVYRVKNVNLSLLVNKKLDSLSKGLSIEEGEDVTSQYALNTSEHLRIEPTTGAIKASSAGYVSDVIKITDYTKNLLVRTWVDQYGVDVAFYKDEDGKILDSMPEAPESGQALTHRIVFPLSAKSFRLSSRRNDYYQVNEFTYVGGGDTTQLESRVSDLETSMESAEANIANLEESSMLSQVIDTVTAVKFKQHRVIYLGANLFDFAQLSYNSNYWSVDAVNGTISYLGGAIDPIVVQVSTDANNSYALECTTSDYVQQTDMFRVVIGDGFQNDPYNGTNNIFCGAFSDGGYLKIYPKQTTNTFTLSNITFRKKVSQGDAVETKTFECLDVNSGNGDAVALDAKWNVAIGPTARTQNTAANLSRSIAIGRDSQNMLIGGLQNIAIGTFSQNMLKYALRNIAIGCDCLYIITHADDCIALGKGCLSGNPGQVNWNDPSTWQHISEIIALGTHAAKVANGQTATKSVYIGNKCGSDGIGSRNTIVGADARCTYNHNNCTGVGYNVVHDKDNQAIFGNSDTTETKVFGNFIVEGTDHVKRKIVFNNGNTCSWEVVS
jgi:hypothetical protein